MSSKLFSYVHDVANVVQHNDLD